MSKPKRINSTLMTFWTTLPSGADDAATVEPSEDEPESSQDTRDELMSSPSPRPPPRKRKSSHSESTATAGPAKKPKLPVVVPRVERDSSSDLDLPHPRSLLQRTGKARLLPHPLSASQPGPSHASSNRLVPATFSSGHDVSSSAPVATSTPGRPLSRRSQSPDERANSDPPRISVARKTTHLRKRARKIGPHNEENSIASSGRTSSDVAFPKRRVLTAPRSMAKPWSEKKRDGNNSRVHTSPPKARKSRKGSHREELAQGSTPKSTEFIDLTLDTDEEDASPSRSNDSPLRHLLPTVDVIDLCDSDEESSRPDNTPTDQYGDDDAQPAKSPELSRAFPMRPDEQSHLDHPQSDVAVDAVPAPSNKRLSSDSPEPSFEAQEEEDEQANANLNATRAFLPSPTPAPHVKATSDLSTCQPSVHGQESDASSNVDGIVPAMDEMELSSTPRSSHSPLVVEEPTLQHLPGTASSSDDAASGDHAPLSLVSSEVWSARDRSKPVSGSSAASARSTPPRSSSTSSLRSSEAAPEPPTSADAPGPSKPSASQALSSPLTTRIRPPITPGNVRAALYNDTEGFFKDVFRRRTYGGHPSQPQSMGSSQPNLSPRRASMPVTQTDLLSPVPLPRPISAGSSSHIRRVSDMSVSSAGSLASETVDSREGEECTAAPLLPASQETVRPSKAQGTALMAEHGREGGVRRPAVEGGLARAISKAKFLKAEEEGNIVDLTQDSDDEEDDTLANSAHASDEEAGLLSAQILMQYMSSTATNTPHNLESNKPLPDVDSEEQDQVVESSNQRAATSVAAEYTVMADEFITTEPDLSNVARSITEDTMRGSTIATEARQATATDDDGQEAEECEHILYGEAAGTLHIDAETPELLSDDASASASQAQLVRRNPRRRATRSASSSASSLADPLDLHVSDPVIVSPHSVSGITEQLVPALNNVRFEDEDEDDIVILSWEKNGRPLAREYADFYQLAKDIPHRLQDEINTMKDAVKGGNDMQVILFESMISENTAQDEPRAPDIEIINDVDDELTPPFEFYYSNKMWHSENVPKPDLTNLLGCGCRGVCDPNSKTCRCARRQQEFYDKSHHPDMKAFAYGTKGKLKYHGYPIVECNIYCGCDEDCRNRVVQHGRKVRISIQKTRNKGWGIFAAERIPANTFLGIYAGEYLTDAEGTERGRKYNEYGRTYLFDIDFWYLKEHEDDAPKYCIDAYHAGNFTRYLNHSCDPNCQLSPCYVNEANMEKPLLAIFTIKDVPVGQELCFSYVGEVDDEPSQGDEAGTDDEKAPVYVKCQCGTVKCRGKMWL